ncbi:EVE domain-containing protein [Ruegeria faecimaris]|uniref:EVE domain-containing protein n=1 Tax=Ruegeria faecimaris TaxID=686389 RepID=UPI0024907932|nr:EVE domain-containing protein [Ruegeria faecimaris]
MEKVDTQTLIARIGMMEAYENLRTLEKNIVSNGAMDPEIEDAIKRQYGIIARGVVAEKTGIDLSNLTPAEERIVLAVAEYVGLMKRDRKTASRTFQQLKNRGLLGAAEVAVAKAKPTQGFTVLNDADRSDLSYEQIIIDHPEEFSERASWYARRALGLPNSTEKPPAPEDTSTQERTETLIQWLKERRDHETQQIKVYTNAEVAEAMGIGDMRRFGQPHGNIQSRLDFACYMNGLPPLGLTAEAPFSKAWKWGEPGWEFPILTMQAAAQQRSWSDDDFDRIAEQTRALPGGASPLWKSEGVENPELIQEWADGLSERKDTPFWVLVCNPKKWAIDAFLESGIELDSWGIRPSDRDKFAPGQLAIIRVGNDGRNATERNGRPALQPGIYAICQVLTKAYEATGASDDFWSPGSEREVGWPTVGIRYLKTFPKNPLTIDKLREELPGASHLLLDGFQAASFPISGDDFRGVIDLLGTDRIGQPEPEIDAGLASALLDIEEHNKDAAPEVKERVSRYIERGPAGSIVKRLNEFKCQICEAQGHNPHFFVKPNGQPYVEAHHVMPVSKLEKGSLHAANIMTVCANHHRQLHYGGVEVAITEANFELELDGHQIEIPRPQV